MIRTHKDLDVWRASILETQIVISKELGYLKEDKIIDKIDTIRRMLLGLIKNIRIKSSK